MEKEIEVPLLRFRPSRRSFVWDYLLIIIVFAVIWAIEYFNLFVNPLGLYAAGIFAILIIGYIEFTRYTNLYMVNVNQIIKDKGLIGKGRESIFVHDVADITVNQGILGRLVNFGNVHIRSRSGKEILLKGAYDAHTTAIKIERLMKRVR